MTTPEIQGLITLAAKALRYEGEWCEVQQAFVYTVADGNYHRAWNPLTSLSDRAAMCDQLEIDIEWNEVRRICVARQPPKGIVCREPYTTEADKSLACSLACAKVAAEMGRRL